MGEGLFDGLPGGVGAGHVPDVAQARVVLQALGQRGLVEARVVDVAVRVGLPAQGGEDRVGVVDLAGEEADRPLVGGRVVVVLGEVDDLLPGRGGLGGAGELFEQGLVVHERDRLGGGRHGVHRAVLRDHAGEGLAHALGEDVLVLAERGGGAVLDGGGESVVDGHVDVGAVAGLAGEGHLVDGVDFGDEFVFDVDVGELLVEGCDDGLGEVLLFEPDLEGRLA